MRSKIRLPRATRQCFWPYCSPTAPIFDKAKACQQLAVIGTKDAVPVLAKLLADEQLAHYARFALEPLPDPTVDETLRASLDQLKGGLLVGVTNSIGMRRDVQAIDPLKALLQDTDPAVAGAAACALGRIASPAAIDILKASLAAPEPVRLAVADGCLTAADTLEKEQKAELAVSIYDAMRGTQLPKYLQIAALAGAIRVRREQGVELLVEQLKSADEDFFEVGLSMAHLIPGARDGDAGRRDLEAAAGTRGQRAGPDHHEGRIRVQGHLGRRDADRGRCPARRQRVGQGWQ